MEPNPNALCWDLTPIQHYYLEEREKQHTGINVQFCLLLTGNISVETIKGAIQKLVTSCDLFCLRPALVEDRPVLIKNKCPFVAFEELDLSNSDWHALEEGQIVQHLSSQKLDIWNICGMKVYYATEGADQLMLIGVCDRFLYDGYSMMLILQNLHSSYAGRPYGHPGCDGDYLSWLTAWHELAASDRGTAMSQYWVKEAASFQSFPFSRAADDGGQYNKTDIEFTTADLSAIARAVHTSEATLVMMCLHMALCDHFNRLDSAISIETSNREDENWREAIGPFAVSLFNRVRLYHGEPYRQLARRIMKKAGENMARQVMVPAPLTNVAFVMHDYGTRYDNDTDIQVEYVESAIKTEHSAWQLVFHCSMDSDYCRLTAVYNTRMFLTSEIEEIQSAIHAHMNYVHLHPDGAYHGNPH